MKSKDYYRQNCELEKIIKFSESSVVRPGTPDVEERDISSKSQWDKLIKTWINQHERYSDKLAEVQDQMEDGGESQQSQEEEHRPRSPPPTYRMIEEDAQVKGNADYEERKKIITRIVNSQATTRMGLMDRFFEDSQVEDKNVAPEESVDAAFSKLESFFDEPKNETSEETANENDIPIDESDDVKFLQETGPETKKQIWKDDLEIIGVTQLANAKSVPTQNKSELKTKLPPPPQLPPILAGLRVPIKTTNLELPNTVQTKTVQHTDTPILIDDAMNWRTMGAVKNDENNDSEFSETNEEKIVNAVNWDDDVQIVVLDDSETVKNDKNSVHEHLKLDPENSLNSNLASENPGNSRNSSGWKITNPHAYKPSENSKTPPKPDSNHKKQRSSPSNVLTGDPKAVKKGRTPLDTSVMKSRLKLIAAEKRSPAYIQYLRQVQRSDRTPCHPRSPDPQDPNLDSKEQWFSNLQTWRMDLQIWRELGDISSQEYAKKMVQVRKKQEQEFFNNGYDKSMIDLLLELELDLNDIHKLLTEYPESALTAEFLDQYSKDKKNKLKNSKFYMENSKIWKPSMSGGDLSKPSSRDTSDGYGERLNDRMKNDRLTDRGSGSRHEVDKISSSRHESDRISSSRHFERDYKRDFEKRHNNREYSRDSRPPFRDDKYTKPHNHNNSSRNRDSSYNRDSYNRDAHERNAYKPREISTSRESYTRETAHSREPYNRDRLTHRGDHHSHHSTRSDKYRGNQQSVRFPVRMESRRDPYDNTRNGPSYPQLGTKRPIISEVSASANYKSGNSNPGLSVTPLVGQTGPMDQIAHSMGHSSHSMHSGHSNHSSYQPSTSKRQKNSSGNWQKLSEATPTDNYEEGVTYSAFTNFGPAPKSGHF